MDSGPYSCDINEGFTMRVLECEDLSIPDNFTVLKEETLDMDDNLEELNEISLLGKGDAIIDRRKTIEEEIWADDDDPQLEKQSMYDLGEEFQSRPPDDQILTHTEKPLLELNHNQYSSNHKDFNFNAEPEKYTILQTQSKLQNQVNLLKCVDCNFDFRRKVSLRSHSYLNNKENAFKCGHCNKEPSTTGIVPKNAVKRSRTQKYTKDFKCYQCGEIFLLKSSLDKHLLIHENKKSYKCPVCSRNFTRKCNLLAHACKVLKSQGKVQGIPKSNSDQPKKVLKKISYPNFNLQAQNSKSRNKRFRCSECGKKFANKSNLNRHSFIHSSVKQKKTFECSECGKKFANKSNLKRHSFIHSSVKQNKRHRCSECGKKFLDNWHLNRHRFTHSSVKQNKRHRCSECGKKFLDKWGLNRHKLTHSEVKPFECNYCNKRFVAKHYLMQHITIHTSEKRYKCKQCNSKFRFSSDFSKHIHRFHLKT